MQISFCPFIMTAVCVCLLWPFLDADLTVNFFKFLCDGAIQISEITIFIWYVR